MTANTTKKCFLRMHKTIHKKLIIKSVTDLNDDTNEEIHSEHCGSIPTAF